MSGVMEIFSLSEKNPPRVFKGLQRLRLPHTVHTSHAGLGAAYQSNVMGTPHTIQIPWAIEAKKIRRGNRPPIAGFDERPGTCVGNH